MAAILLKPLKTAQRDGDPIRAVIRGSSVGSDGKTQGITMPSSEAYLRNIENAYKQAGLNPRDTLFIEAHGKLTIRCYIPLCIWYHEIRDSNKC